MALDKQINIYSCDTGHFYSNKEAYLHNMNCRYRQERNYVKNKCSELKKQLLALGIPEKDITLLAMERAELKEKIDTPIGLLLDEYLKCTYLIKHKARKADESKKKLLLKLENKIKANIKNYYNNKSLNHMRQLNAAKLNDTNVISVFESSLSRMLNIESTKDLSKISDALIVVQIYYFDVFKDLCHFGFELNGEKYVYYTSSAGQIRKKKAVFIKEQLWKEHEKTIMCGLTIDKINEKGGNNVNKHLAYMALTNSATDEWEDFDIDRTIVIEDFETEVLGEHDLVNETDYSITRKIDYVPIAHTDGAGMVLWGKNRMCRLPWIKGLLGVFDYISLIKEKGWSSKIKDIYGKEYDLIEDDIRVIFTKSQFKMWKYYDSWEQYKDYFKKYNCKAGICNVEEDRIKNAKINYQMLQTITDITDAEIESLALKSANKISNLCQSIDSMKSALGITPYNTNPTYFQQAVKIYPALLNDTYAKDVLRSIKNSLLHKYRSGKIEINGKYVFILPDFYAACEYWFGHINNPKGLLNNGEVFCPLLKYYDKLDCLRSPHLYREHAVRTNVAHAENSEELYKWFNTNAIYTSIHDLISKILQFDVDGDKSLVVADPEFIKIVERNMEGIVPLYYNMRKAEPQPLTQENIYNGLKAAFTGAPIGVDSNEISKIWNSDVFTRGTKAEQDEAITCIKWLCMENNFHIDYAKTLYKPIRPEAINKIISKYTKYKLPAFFEFAKDKEKGQIEVRNESFVNKLYNVIPNKNINTRGLNLGKINYFKMMHDVNTVCVESVSNLYSELNSKYRYKLNSKDENVDNLSYIACTLRNEFVKLGYDEQTIADMLIRYIYGNNIRYKELLWFCFGKYIVDNLKKNVLIKKTKDIQCEDCGEWIEVEMKDNHTRRCESCQNIYNKNYHKEYMKKKRKLSC